MRSDIEIQKYSEKKFIKFVLISVKQYINRIKYELYYLDHKTYNFFNIFKLQKTLTALNLGTHVPSIETTLRPDLFRSGILIAVRLIFSPTSYH